MATYTNIPDSVLEPGKPIRSVDGLALRDNPIAIAQGAAGAPRVQTSALADSAVTTAKVANGNVTAGKLAAGAAETSWVGARYGGIGAGGVGTYALCIRANDGTTGIGGAIAGSGISLVSIYRDRSGAIDADSGTTPAGTWRVMSGRLYRYAAGGSADRTITLAMRIS